MDTPHEIVDRALRALPGSSGFARAAVPARAAGPASVVRSGTAPGGEPLVVLQPGQAGVRVTGPGRLERSYRTRIQALEETLVEGADRARSLERELEVAQLVERGSGRLTDRLEIVLTERREELEQVRSQGSRLLVTLGALQRENEGLRHELERARARAARLEAPRPRRGAWSALARLWGRQG